MSGVLQVAWIAPILFVLLFLTNGRKTALPLPPGPKPKFLLGNLLDIPAKEEYVTYQQWSKQYNSGVIFLSVLGTKMIIVNTAKAAKDLLERRSGLYSDRPPMTALNSLLKFGWLIGFIPYGNRWRNYRRVFRQFFRASVVGQYRPREISAAHELLRRLLETRTTSLCTFGTGNVIIGIAYGIDVKPTGDPYIESADKSLSAINRASVPESGLLDSWPSLRNWPDWLPGAEWIKQARRDIHLSTSVYEEPYKEVKNRFDKGEAAPSVLSDLMARQDADPSLYTDALLKHVPGVMYLAGADTTVSALSSFLQAMVLYPNCQKKAQEEIDSVIGNDRLPNFDDKSSLPYVGAILKETLRWQVVLPFAIPHRLTSDDVYEGMYLPGGSIVMGNAWAVLHDESVYSHPDQFDSERYLTDELKDTFPDVAFGFGRRECPGRYMAQDAVWITMASILSVFNLSKAKDEQGREIEIKRGMTPGLMTYPYPFRCEIKPRSDRAEQLIQNTRHTD